MWRSEIVRLLSGTMGKYLTKFTGPKLLLIVAAMVGMLWGYAKFKGARLDAERKDHANTKLERDAYADAVERLNAAAALLEQFNQDRQHREDQAKQAVTDTLTATDSSLDNPVPVNIAEQLRQSPTLDTGGTTSPEVGADSADGS